MQGGGANKYRAGTGIKGKWDQREVGGLNPPAPPPPFGKGLFGFCGEKGAGIIFLF